MASPSDSLNLERQVLGAILFDNGALQRVRPLLEPRHFTPRYAPIYAAMVSVGAQDRPIDPLTLADALGPQLESVGGIEALNTIDTDSYTAAGVEEHARMVREAYDRRALAEWHRTAHGALAFEPVDSAIAAARAQLDALAAARPSPRWVALKDAAPAAVNRLDAQQRGALPPQGQPLRSHLIDVETAIGVGLRPGWVRVIGARPSEGKTALGLQMARHMAAKAQEQCLGDVLIFTLEVPVAETVNKLLAQEAGIPLTRLIEGDIYQGDEWTRLSNAAFTLSRLPIHVDCVSRTIDDIVAAVEAYQRPIALVVVDYLQAVQSRRHSKKHDRVTAVTEALRELALRGGHARPDRHLRILALAQLNRASEADNRRPGMRDLEYAGQIEQDANQVLLIYRPDANDPSHVLIVVPKNRNGPKVPKGVPVRWRGECVRFENAAAGSW